MSKVKSQASKDKQSFCGLFDRGEVYKEAELLKQKTVLKDQKTAHDDQNVILGCQLTKIQYQLLLKSAYKWPF